MEDIAVPAYVWQGELDQTVPITDAQYLAQAIPGCRAVYFPEDGHLIPPHYWAGILTTLLAEDGR